MATEKILKQWFPKEITVEQVKDPGATGNFEITVDGVLVHSKRTRGQGFFDVAPKGHQELVREAIDEALSQ